jgi:ribose 5-phosphate isomerase B
MNQKELRIAIDCDDAATELKTILYNHIKAKGLHITDLKYSASQKADYPEIGHNLAMKIKAGEFDRGLLICGTGLGMAIIANKVEGVYAGVCHDVYSAQRLLKSNNAQVLTMGARVIGSEHAKTIVDAWLDSEFEGGRSTPKVEKIKELEKQAYRANRQ